MSHLFVQFTEDGEIERINVQRKSTNNGPPVTYEHAIGPDGAPAPTPPGVRDAIEWARGVIVEVRVMALRSTLADLADLDAGQVDEVGAAIAAIKEREQRGPR